MNARTFINSFVTASDGCELAVRKLAEGAADAQPLLLIHALAMDGSMWADVAGELTGHTIYAMDCRGHGLSQKPMGPYSIGQFAQDAVDVLDALGITQAAVAGCSMGGTVALGLAGRFPQRVSSLTVIDTTAWYGEGAPEAWEQRANRAVNEGLAALLPFQLERWFGEAFRQANPVAVASAIRVFTANQVAPYAASCRMLGQADEREALRQYTGPAEVVVGSDDYATPRAMAADITSRIVGAHLTVIPGARHYTPIESAPDVARCIRSAVQRTAPLYSTQQETLS